MYTKSRIKTNNLANLKERRKKKEMLLDSVVQKTASYPLGYQGIVIVSFIKVIVPQSKAHILQRFPKIGRRSLNFHMSKVNVDSIYLNTCFVYIHRMCEMNCILSSFSTFTCGTIKQYMSRFIQYLHNGV